MDRAVIIGVYEYVGFQFCCSLLEQGFEVIGISFDHSDRDGYLSEKRLEIGRNANFYERTLSEWINEEEINSQTFILIDYFDFIINNHKELIKNNNLIEKFLNQNQEKILKTNSKVVSLFPMQLHMQPNETGERILTSTHSGQQIFLPTIYGPWQPNTFLFQQYLLKAINPDHTISENNYEWVHDTLYIEDIVDPILKIAEQNTEKQWVLESDISDHWKKCAEYLSIPSTQIEKIEWTNLPEHTKINKTIIKCLTPLTEGLEKQKRHLKLFHVGRI